MMDDNLEQLGLGIDDLLNLRAALLLPLPSEMHINVLRSKLPEVIRKIHESYVALGGDPLDLD